VFLAERNIVFTDVDGEGLFQPLHDRVNAIHDIWPVK
jgi:hypothetical protein